ncbi:putative RING-H2 finger protein ATL69 [Cucurbita pepo subsp. pepo]|uniref:putative RING-H2 finger protein ATL69 n=1 Tax=Cucurbita pepo subsp. pepo TaxID=3664 RepID=UPI000C9D63FC|nr:putative RING-H2 finger protein ATL69 [Cucurbita pepo subsp. pepo]
MSSADPPSSSSSSAAAAASPAHAGVGLGYGIAIAVSILVFISTIMLVSYACIRAKSTRPRPRPSAPLPPPAADNVVVLMVGLDGSIIESYPKLVLGESRRLPAPNHGPCSICLSDYQPYDSVRCIPDCRHCFHSACVDEWLRMSATCPLCRNSPAPTPVATPLSEFAPLASNAR